MQNDFHDEDISSDRWIKKRKRRRKKAFRVLCFLMPCNISDIVLGWSFHLYWVNCNWTSVECASLKYLNVHHWNLCWMCITEILVLKINGIPSVSKIHNKFWSKAIFKQKTLHVPLTMTECLHKIWIQIPWFFHDFSLKFSWHKTDKNKLTNNMAKYKWNFTPLLLLLHFKTNWRKNNILETKQVFCFSSEFTIKAQQEHCSSNKQKQKFPETKVLFVPLELLVLLPFSWAP